MLTSSQKAHLLFRVWDAKTLVLDKGPSKQPEGNRNMAVHQLLLQQFKSAQVNRREQPFPHANTNPLTPNMHSWCRYHPRKSKPRRFKAGGTWRYNPHTHPYSHTPPPRVVQGPLWHVRRSHVDSQPNNAQLVAKDRDLRRAHTPLRETEVSGPA